METLNDQIEKAIADAVLPIDRLARACHLRATDAGWWDEDRNDGELIALIHSEASEMLESLRHGDPADSHIPDFTGAEAEAADIIIRVLDMCAARKWRIGEAIQAKMAYNASRPPKHGKHF